MTSVEAPGERHTTTDVVAGLLAAGSLVLSGIGSGLGLILEVEARPARTIPVAIIVALVAARMSSHHRLLALVATLVGAVAFVVGMTVAVATDSPLF